jgi:hypothetical protein
MTSVKSTKCVNFASRIFWTIFGVPFFLIFWGVNVQDVKADEVDIIRVSAKLSGDGTYQFSVTVKHADNGWLHYADKWDVLGPDGHLLGSRILLHPHDGEQPFTRGLSAVRVPAGISRVTVRAHDKVHGYGGKTVTVVLPGR